MLGDPGSREAGTFRQPGSRSAVRDHLLGGSAPARQKLLCTRWHRLREGRFSFRDRGQSGPPGFYVATVAIPHGVRA
jgi:hypothetical protein